MPQIGAETRGYGNAAIASPFSTGILLDIRVARRDTATVHGGKLADVGSGGITRAKSRSDEKGHGDKYAIHGTICENLCLLLRG